MALSDKLTQKIENASTQVLNQMGREGVRYIKWLASVRVTGSGANKVRSQPGEPPRRETGTLYKSIKFRIERRGRGADIVFYSNDNYLKLIALETTLDRPLWKTAKKQFGDLRRVFEQRLREKLKSMKGDPFGLLPSANEE